MAYHRGSIGAYQRWADLVGDQSYTFDKILPYFKKTSTLTPPNLAKRNAPNATVRYDPSAFDNALRGPLQVSWANWVDPTQSWLARALQAIGQTLSTDGFSSGKVHGGAWVPTTIDPKDATRSTSRSSYLDKLGEGNNSKPIIYVRSQASKILFDKKKTTTGVEIITERRQYVLSAKKEVILSAGVFHSPQLLMLSGMSTISLLLYMCAKPRRRWSCRNALCKCHSHRLKPHRRRPKPLGSNLLQRSPWYHRSEHRHISQFTRSTGCRTAAVLWECFGTVQLGRRLFVIREAAPKRPRRPLGSYDESALGISHRLA